MFRSEAADQSKVTSPRNNGISQNHEQTPPERSVDCETDKRHKNDETKLRAEGPDEISNGLWDIETPGYSRKMLFVRRSESVITPIGYCFHLTYRFHGFIVLSLHAWW